ncbi:nitrile hydratase subunit beta [Shimia sp. R9_1]|uniref:nitrile hydratase subunit beta n=1 Tax=Shimia sp. R9_1 TaxID=2821111 RepID=UPI001ADD0AE8|nr:nitrile hydratase subunit beta [Shimia sp. R9_1]MBO9408807.1 nitrile hydratase subunit beta [Shimia sp. R9_1]
MSRIHDMGGRLGTGPVDPTDGYEFAEAKDWHKRALALNVACGFLGQWNIDASRHARELLSPEDYTRFSYYEKWMGGLADLMVARGVLTEEELASGQAEGVSPVAERAAKPGAVTGALMNGSAYTREAAAPQFTVGAKVQTRRPARNVMVQGGHTRLPAYASGAKGEVVVQHGAHVFPDSNAHFQDEAAEPLYAVRFSARELWGAEADPRDEVVLDLWESYLEPAE